MNEYICVRETFFKMRLFQKGDVGYGKDFSQNPNFEPKNKKVREGVSKAENNAGGAA